MKITGYRIRTFPNQTDRALGDANTPGGNGTSMPGSLLYIDTDENISGIVPGGSPMVGQLFPLIEGEDPRGVRGLWKKMMDAVFKGGAEGGVNMALNAIDMALWDLKAKLADEPLWRTLGASEPRTKVYASGVDMNLTDDEVHEFYSRAADRGIDGGKLKVGLDMEADIRRLGIVNDCLKRVTPRPMLAIDSNEYWSPKQAIRYTSELERHFDITWIEEPARRWDYEGLRLVSQNVKAAVATGENINGLADFYPLIANEAVDIVQVWNGRTGITGAMQVAHMAYAFELPVTTAINPGNYMAPLGAALPNHISMEMVDAGQPPCWHADQYVEDGWIHMGDTPGLGIIVDEEKLSELEALSRSGPQPGARPRFARREGAGLYIVPATSDEVVWK
ncbi:MAG: mandelate racemase/muconate lactonizing enzyme family protein [Chloroflexi bacterium]|nr:mandelate racemase/muconate lactonizing enzyme family protein [Chloroflexota bacterium]